MGKTTRPFRYDLNQMLNDYIVEVKNRFKGLDLIECLMNNGWRFVTLYRRQGWRPSPRKRNAIKQTGCLKRPYKELWREHTGYNKHPLPTTQEMTQHTDINRWSILKSGRLYHLQPKMDKLHIVSKNKTRSWLWLRSLTPNCTIQTWRKWGKPLDHSGMT